MNKAINIVSDGLSASENGATIKNIQLRSFEYVGFFFVISTLEAEEPLLATISEQDMRLVMFMTDKASKIVWISNADVMSGTRPDFAPALGLLRALILG